MSRPIRLLQVNVQLLELGRRYTLKVDSQLVPKFLIRMVVAKGDEAVDLENVPSMVPWNCGFRG